MRWANFETALFIAFAIFLVWLPVPLGSNRPEVWVVMEIGAFALLAAWIIGWGFGKVSAPVTLRRAWPAWFALATWLTLQILHVVPLPVEIIAAISPAAARIQSLAADANSGRAWTTLSIDPHASKVALLKSLAYCAIFFLTIALANRRPRVAALAQVLTYAAVSLAFYAVLLHLAGVKQDWFGARLSHVDSSIGTFVNRNHFAGYLEMCLAIGTGLLIAGISDRSADSLAKFVRYTIDWVLSPKMVLRLGLCVLVIALTTTHSRMGNTAFFAGLLIAGLIGIVLSRYATRNTTIVLASLVVIDLLIVGSWFGVEKLAERVQQTTMASVQEREEPPEAAFGLIRDYPIFGAGPGSFYLAFPPYRTERIVAFFDHAHNDFVEIAAENGIVGLFTIGSFVILSLGAALLGQWNRRDPLMRGMSFACIMGVTSILIHSWVDFNLQIPANAALFMVLCALGWISLYLDRREGAARTRNDDA